MKRIGLFHIDESVGFAGSIHNQVWFVPALGVLIPFATVLLSSVTSGISHLVNLSIVLIILTGVSVIFFFFGAVSLILAPLMLMHMIRNWDNRGVRIRSIAYLVGACLMALSIYEMVVVGSHM